MLLRSLPLLSLACAAVAVGQSGYMKPSQPIVNLLDAAPTPVVALSPDHKMLAVQQPASFPTITDLSQPELRLAGIRFSPVTSGPSRGAYMVDLKLQPLSGGKAVAVTGLPAHPHMQYARWSPDGKHLAFVQMDSAAQTHGSSLWVADAATHAAHRVGTFRVNAIFGAPCDWLADSQSLLCVTVPAVRGTEPKHDPVPSGPVISENLGKVTPARTYEDLLQTPEDERIFEYYATAEVATVRLNGVTHPFPATKGVLRNVDPSPDGHYALVETLHRPFSYALPAENFPVKIAVLDLHTGTLQQLADKPLEDSTPIAFDAVATGPRGYRWRADVPATLTWAEAGDGGDPRKKVDVHDRVFALSAPFKGQPETLAELPMRFGGIEWGNAHTALINERRRSDRKRVILLLDPEAKTTKTLFEGSSEDRYHDPGMAVLTPNAQGRGVLQFSADGGIYFRGQGASPQGDQPFLDLMPLGGGKATRVWQSKAPFFEEPLAVLDGNSILIEHESETLSPNYYLVNPADASMKQVTTFANPYGATPLPTKKVLHYKRDDGVNLTATLWVPAGYKPADGPLPTLMEAYPAEFKTRAGASQVAGSPYRFPRFNWGSPVFFAASGYAVLQNAAIPIIGEGKDEPNDTYTQQLVAGAKAAVDAGAATGAVDAKRVGVMGHSYGAFMTANLLAHSNLFRAGIARSGAYNRTLTPYGFQNEARTYWQAPEIYNGMSPFMFADKIKTPILLIHGMADDNQGTFPLQSERFFVALKGQGATVRLVFLPLEAHHYDAHESVYHMLWEMEHWLDTYVKPSAPATNRAATGE